MHAHTHTALTKYYMTILKYIRAGLHAKRIIFKTVTFQDEVAAGATNRTGAHT